MAPAPESEKALERPASARCISCQMLLPLQTVVCPRCGRPCVALGESTEAREVACAGKTPKERMERRVGLGCAVLNGCVMLGASFLPNSGSSPSSRTFALLGICILLLASALAWRTRANYWQACCPICNNRFRTLRICEPSRQAQFQVVCRGCKKRFVFWKQAFWIADGDEKT